MISPLSFGLAIALTISRHRDIATAMDARDGRHGSWQCDEPPAGVRQAYIGSVVFGTAVGTVMGSSTSVSLMGAGATA